MIRRYLGYHNLLAVRKSTTNGTNGAILDCWVVPAHVPDGLGVFLHNDSVIYNCLMRSSVGGGDKYNTSAEFKSANEAYDAAGAYCRSHGYVYAFAFLDDNRYNLGSIYGSSTNSESQVMEFI